MKKTIIICDRCQNEAPCYTVYIPVGFQHGYDSTEIKVATVDLCLDCCGKQLNLCLVDLPAEQGAYVYKRLASGHLLTRFPVRPELDTNSSPMGGYDG